MNRKRVMIAAPKSGSGKTMVTCALLSVLKKKGYQTVSCKCGPDYIDPMFHEKVIGVPSKNLDTFFTGEAQTKELFFNHVQKSDAVVLEGVMGLYDGLGGIREEGSSYHLAKITKTPVILVVDAKGMGRSVMALVAGFLDYDTEHLIRGVILNKISKGYYEVIKPLIERELKLPVLGFLPETKEMQTESRHLGLVLPEELENIREKLETASEKFKETVSIEEIMKIAADAEEIGMPPASFSVSKRYGAAVDTGEKPVIAVARDEAFCFYYADNIQMLKEYGAEIKYFSPLHDEKLPVLCHALLIGGGYPELYAEELSKNEKMRMEVKRAFLSGMPVVAECGGFLYLHTALKNRDGNCYAMAGAVPAVCYEEKLFSAGRHCDKRT